MIPVTECRTAADVRALARRFRSPAKAQVVTLPPKPVEASPPEIYRHPPSDAFCHRVIAAMWKDATDGRITVRAITAAVCTHFSVTEEDIISARRFARVVRPRQIAMYLSKTLTLRSLPDIGRRFGGRDHTTVLHAVRKIEMLLAVDAELAADVNHLRGKIERRA